MQASLFATYIGMSRDVIRKMVSLNSGMDRRKDNTTLLGNQITQNISSPNIREVESKTKKGIECRKGQVDGIAGMEFGVVLYSFRMMLEFGILC